MKHALLTPVFAMALGLVAYAQNPAPGDSRTNPSAQPQTSPSQTPDMSNAGNQDQNKSEKKLKGCIQSAGGNFVLQNKHGKEVALTGSQDFASHVGHTVTLHGTYTANTDAGSNAASGTSGTGEQFMVSKIDMVSDTCKEKAEKTQNDHDNSKPSPYQQ